MKCHNAPYATKEKFPSVGYVTKLRKGDYSWIDPLGRVIYRFMSIGDTRHLYTPLECPFFTLVIPTCRYWVKWLDYNRQEIFIVPYRDSKHIGCVITFKEFYFSFISPPLV